MNTFIKCFRAELLKLRRTLTFWMVLLAPLVVQMLNFGMWATRDMNAYNDNFTNLWTHYFFNLRTFWVILMLPLFIALESALLASVEHSSQQWRRLFTLPVPRGSVYAAKWAVGALVTLLASLMMVAETYLGGITLDLISERYPFMSTSLPWMELIGPMLLAWLLSLLMISIHTWISLRFHNFTVSVGIGMAAAIANIMLIESDEPWSLFFPWLLQANVLDHKTVSLVPALALSIAGGLLVALIGGWLVTRRDVV